MTLLFTNNKHNQEYISSELKIINNKIHNPIFKKFNINDAKKYIEKKIKKNMPISKILKQKYFWKDIFYTGKHVLDPRQETEIIIDKSIYLIKKYKLKSLLDLGTGSGCIAISLQKEFKHLTITAIDISKKALNIAKYNTFKILHKNSKLSFKQNVKNNHFKINFIKSNWFNNLHDKKYDIIISNPPYISNKEKIDITATFDPKEALYAKNNGLKNYIDILSQAHLFINQNGFLLLEIGYNQKEKIKNIPTKLKYIKTLKDYNQKNRCMIFKKE